jgi:hypothetical protein
MSGCSLRKLPAGYALHIRSANHKADDEVCMYLRFFVALPRPHVIDRWRIALTKKDILVRDRSIEYEYVASSCIDQ